MNSTYGLIAILTVLLCSVFELLSQVPYDEAYKEEASGQREYISLFTDRNMYTVNERICFSAFYRQGREPATEPWSKVLYVELVTPSGSPVTNGKFHLGVKGSSGYLVIPADVITGNYYLRSYTRWMQNFGPQSYCYTPLKIINPYKKEILTGNNESSGLTADLMRMSHPGVTCSTNKISYAPGEEVRLELGGNGYGEMLTGEYCITVVHAGMCDSLNAQVNIGEASDSRDFQFNYLPEIRGVSLSGSVVNIEDQSPAPRVRVHFSIPGKQADYFGTMTDELGRFILTLPGRTGTQELFVACEPSGNLETEIRIDQDFATDPIPFMTGHFTLSPYEKEVATRMVLNMQFSNAYKLVQTNPPPGSERDSIVPFYGKPTTTINLDEFIKLPTMNEVVVNIVPDVFVFYNDGEPYFNIYSSSHNVSIFPPLILIDDIPIFDPNAILSIDPERIERIEVVNDVYVRGGLMYGGMIFITSRQGDMAAVDLPEGSYFFDYQAFHPGSPGEHSVAAENIPVTGLPPSDRIPDTRNSVSETVDRIPDTRNTLLWIDKITLSSEETTTLQFPASSQSGEYIVLVRGLSPGGEIVYGRSSFKVEKQD